MAWILRIVILASLVYSGYVWFNHIQSEKSNTLIRKKVISINCNAIRSNSVNIKFKGKIERVEIPRKACNTLSVDDEIDLIYSKELESLHFREHRADKSMFMFLAILFLMSFANLGKLKEKFEGKISALLKKANDGKG